MIVTSELRAIATLCENLDSDRTVLLQDGDITMGPVPLYDANGEQIGRVSYDEHADGFVFEPA